MTGIEELIARWQNKEIDGTALMRGLVSYTQWNVQVSEAAANEMLQQNLAPRIMFNQDPQGVSRLYLYSGSDAYGEFCRAVNQPAASQYFLTTRGTWIFRLPLEQIDWLVIDPATPHEIAYNKDQFARLKQLADAITVEESLLELRTNPEAGQDLLAIVRQYHGYLLAVSEADDNYRLAMAPDTKGRALAAVFTFEDAFVAFMNESKQAYPEVDLRGISLPGPALFAELAKVQVDGVVFNCAGPVKPVAFAPQFAEIILNSRPNATD